MNNFTKTLIVAFLFSLAIHFIMYFTIDRTLQNNKLNMNTTTKKLTTKKNGLVKIKYVKIKPKKEIKKEKPKPKESIEKKEINKIAKKVIKKKSIKKAVKKTIPLITLPVKQTQAIDLKKFFTIQKQEQETRDLEQKKALERQEEIKEIQELPALTQSYIKLYGEKFFEFSETQRRYLKQNLNKIGKITQRYLEYPRVSIRTKQQGVNIIEFYLHPNGDITELKLIDSSSYTALDRNTVYTIKLAYQDYPRPFEKVKVIINVKYLLY